MKLAIIDGTGDFSDASYAAEMRFSFCRQMADQTGAQPPQSSTDAQYERGPSFDGLRTRERGERAADFLKAAKTRGPAQKLYLAGYSRGASAAIMAAEILAKDKIDVDGMFLFDPVARHMSSGGEVVPANVKQTWVARRSLDPELVRKYEKAELTAYLPVSNPMRPWFGGTATRALGTGLFKSETFRGSHGALGGVGWKKVAEDSLCQQQVATWMNAAFTEAGLSITLRPHPPSS